MVARSPQQFGEGHTGYTAVAAPRPDRRLVTPAEWREFQTRGFLKVKQLVAPDDVERLRARMAELRAGAPLDLPDGEYEKVYKWSSSPEQLARRGLVEEEGQQTDGAGGQRAAPDAHAAPRGPNGRADDAASADTRLSRDPGGPGRLVLAVDALLQPARTRRPGVGDKHQRIPNQL